jgi:hypothetical protein
LKYPVRMFRRWRSLRTRTWLRHSPRIAPIQAFREGILPRASGSREDLMDAHPLHALTEGVTVDRVSVAEEIGGGGVVRESVHDLLSGPRSGRMRGDVEVHDSAAMVSEDDQDKEHPQLSGGNGKEVDRD